jgi:transposase-like protein
MIESFNARVRSAVTRHGHFPNETAARKVVYLVVRGHGGWPKRSDPAKRVNNWKMALNQLVLRFGERLNLQ